MDLTTNAVILAGGINRIILFDGYVPGYKALLPVGGRASVHYTLDALKRLPEIGRIAVVGPERDLRRELAGEDLDYLPGGETLSASLIEGLRHFPGQFVLITTADIPLITSSAIGEFLRRSRLYATESSPRVYLSLVEEAHFGGKFRDAGKGFARFRGISVCHGNLALADTRILDHPKMAPRLDRLYRSRKHSLRTALALGWSIGLSYMIGAHLFRVMTLDQMAGLVSRRLGVGFVPVLLNRPEVTLDIDEARDYELVVKILRNGWERG